ncbi:LacI family transcriptional regulator [Scopulibacillus darangshiensis]|uniref:LacI family transcriptional regulator n=1 Tax=Scopulibacillus darangshiensis TaxID=442528 RepID=A0A4R2NQ91_9BACL|nr:LacI family DNA-binding transcriptional regulator [Scopulibacillus darangshiensis]TCP23475.1 LacI family transcriptional regulator [Scopulibacillus darangshiensis]
MPTIEDVAKLAGLSPATISRVINNHPYVSQEKKDIVAKAMKELGYVPNSNAQRLRRQKTETIAVLIQRIANPFFSQLVESMDIIADRNNYKLLICQTNNDKEKELKYLNLLKTKQIDAVIFASIENEWSIVEGFLKYGPIIFCNDFAETAPVPIVCLDQYKGSYIGTKHLIDRGYKRLSYCGGSKATCLSRDRRAGFMAAVKEAGLNVSDQWLFKDALTIDDGKQILREIASMDNRPDAIFTGSDEVAAGLITEAKRHGITVPNDLGVLGFDDQPIAELVEPGITTIHQPVRKIGIKAMDVMIDILVSKKKLEHQFIQLPFHLVVRESTR